MELSYENRMNLAFDKPLIYKNILLYPATLRYYDIFAVADDCLDINRINEKDIELLRLPYLDYMYRKSLLEEDFKYKWNMLIFILNIVLGTEQILNVIENKENNRLYIKVCQKSKDYDLLKKEYDNLTMSFLNQLNSKTLTEKSKSNIQDKLKDLESKLYIDIIINAQEFDEIRELIMLQNDIKSEHYSEESKKILEETRQKLKQAKGDSGITFEDLVTAVCYSTHINPSDIENMTIRRFNRYLDITLRKDDYYLYKQAELSGSIELKTELKHWISHYEPKGRYEGLLVKNNDLMSLANDGKI